MDEFKMTQQEMISALDTACGMLIVASMSNKEVYGAKELIMKVSIALGEVDEMKYTDYSDAE